MAKRSAARIVKRSRRSATAQIIRKLFKLHKNRIEILKSARSILYAHAAYENGNFRRHIGGDITHIRNWIVVHNLAQHLSDVRPNKRTAPCNHLKENNSERIDIGSNIYI